MKILMVHPHDIYSDLEPWTVRIAYFAQELTRAGYHIRLVYHSRPARASDKQKEKKQYDFETIELSREGMSMRSRCRRLTELAGWADIVHFQKCHHYSALPAVIGAYYNHRPVHYDWDDWEQRIYELDKHSRIGSWIFFNQMERHLLKLVDTVSVASEGLRLLAIKYGFPENRIFHAPVGVNTEVFSPATDGSLVRRSLGAREYVVLYQGQISGGNYVHLFIEAVKSIGEQRSDVTFVVVGGGDRLEQAKKYSDDLGLQGRINFVGEVPHADVPGYIAAADVVVACFEDNEQVRCKSPLKIVEYMASGKAIVASRVGEVPGMIGDTGLLVDPGSSESVFVAVNKLLDDQGLREMLGNAARSRAEERLTWKHTAQTLTRAYERAVLVTYGIH